MGGSVRIISDPDPGGPKTSVPEPEHCLKLYYFAACRIFLGGKDGCLYEFVYRAEKGWWGQRTQKINLSSGNLRWMTVTGYLQYSLVLLLSVFAPSVVTRRNSFCNLSMFLNEWFFRAGRSSFSNSLLVKHCSAFRGKTHHHET